jgi:hypothetical protein
MSEEKFTPGPWNNCDGFTVETRKARICIIASLNVSDEASEANAALIAAAPEMCEFLEWLRSIEGQCAILNGKKYLPQILEKVDEILKKVRGEL